MNYINVDDILYKTENKIAYCQYREELIRNNKNRKRVSILASIIVVILFVASFSYADEIKEFINNVFHISKGMETAISNGYIENVEMEYLDGNSINAKVRSFVIDDHNLSIEFDIEGKVDYKIDCLYIEKMIIRDEKNRILFSNFNEDDFNLYCKENNYKQTYGFYNDNYINSGINQIPSVGNESSSIITNIYTESTYGRVEKLNILIEEIKINEKIYNEKIEIELDVPTIMQEQDYKYYKVVSNEIDNCYIHTAKLGKTGLEIGMYIYDIKKPEKSKELEEKEGELSEQGAWSFGTKDEFISLFGDEKYLKMYEDYENKYRVINLTGISYEWSKPSGGTYVLDKNNNKYTSTYNPGRKAQNEFISSNVYSFFETFNLTSFDEYDEITLIVDYYRKPKEISLKIIN